MPWDATSAKFAPHRREIRWVLRLSETAFHKRVNELARVRMLTPVSEAPGGWSVELCDPDAHPLAVYQDEQKPRRL